MVGNNIRRGRPVDDHTSVVLRKCPPMADYYTLAETHENTRGYSGTAYIRQIYENLQWANYGAGKEGEL